MKGFLIVFISFFSLMVQGQDLALQLGGHFGYGLSGLVGPNATESGTSFSPYTFQVGSNIHFPFSNHFGLFSSVSYSVVDINTELLMRPYPFLPGDVENFEYPYSFTTQAISFPALFRGMFGQRTQCFIQGGVQLDFLLKRMLYTDLTWPHSTLPPENPNGWGPIERDITEFGDAIEFSGVLGTGINTKISNQLILETEIRMAVGLKSWQYGSQIEAGTFYEGRQAQALLIVGVRYILP